MALTLGQKDFITAAIQDYFVFDEIENEQDLKDEITNLIEVLNDKEVSVYKGLAEIFDNPKKLNRLADYGNKDITIGEVKLFMLEYIDNQIKSAAINCGIPQEASLKEKLGWDYPALRSKITCESAYNKPFADNLKAEDNVILNAQAVPAANIPVNAPVIPAAQPLPSKEVFVNVIAQKNQIQKESPYIDGGLKLPSPIIISIDHNHDESRSGPSSEDIRARLVADGEEVIAKYFLAAHPNGHVARLLAQREKEKDNSSRSKGI